MYRQHMAALKSMVSEFRAKGVSIFVTGDFNVNYRRDAIVRDPAFPYVNMAEVRVEASYESLGMPPIGTHGGGTRLIDYVSHLRRNVVTPLSQQVLRGYTSDHRPVLVEYQLEGFRR